MGAWDKLIDSYIAYDKVSSALKRASLAQWILESRRGTSKLATEHLNFGGLKYRKRMSDYADPVKYTGSDGEPTEYCEFDSVRAFIKGYWHFIDSGPYEKWEKYKDDADGYIRYVAEVGYAADGDYAEKVLALTAEAEKLLGLGDGKTGGKPSSGDKVPEKPDFEDALVATYRNTRTTPVLGIVLHDTAGAGTHNDTKYLANPGDDRKVSVDFTVERDGSIWNLNPELKSYYCNHAGRATSWRGYLNKEVNRVTVGIEIVQKSDLSLDPLYPAKQVTSVAKLCAWLTHTFGLTAADITTHRQIITDGSRSDPRKFPFDTEDGFWAQYWACFGKSEQFLTSLNNAPSLNEEHA